jgi:plasmid maintenance system antidote protein VapI
MIINNFIKDLVDANQVTIDEISELSGINIEHITEIVEMKSAATPNEAYRILKVLGCDLGDVLEGY